MRLSRNIQSQAGQLDMPIADGHGFIRTDVGAVSAVGSRQAVAARHHWQLCHANQNIIRRRAGIRGDRAAGQQSWRRRLAGDARDRDA